jgi:hypothetical protein
VTRVFLVGILALGLLGSCDSGSIEDQLVLTFAPYSTPVTVDTNCENGGCSMEDRITAMLAFDPDTYVSEETRVEFEQYRVDEYDIDEIEDEIPYFASPLDVVVLPDQTTTFYVYAAGQTQRDFVREAVGTEPAQGTALLTLAGYDDMNEQVFLEKSFDISFGDFRVNEDGSDGSDGSSE